MSSRTLHHSVFSEFAWSFHDGDEEFLVNAIGARQRAWYDRGVVPNASRYATPSASVEESPTTSAVPGLNEEYFEWIDVLESVCDYRRHGFGRRPYVFAELGAGFGRWSVNAIQALRQVCPAPYFLCAVEADKQHFEWLRLNLRDNGIDPDEHLLVDSPLTGNGRRVGFLAGDYGNEFGQQVISGPAAFRLRVTGRIPGLGRRLFGWLGLRHRLFKPLRNRFIVEAASITLQDVLERFEYIVDIMDFDLQGVEAEVVESALHSLRRRVLRLHIGTHSQAVEERLRGSLGRAGWHLLRDLGCHGTRETPFGSVAFGDGVQSWINLELASKIP